jgi:hypothetical protein
MGSLNGNYQCLANTVENEQLAETTPINMIFWEEHVLGVY